MSVKKLVINGEEHSIEAENGWVKTVNGVAWDVILSAWENMNIENNVFSATDTTYSAWKWIEIKDSDYSPMQWPCLDGYHIPIRDEWVALCGILTTTFWLAQNATTMGTYLKMPMAGTRNRSSSNVDSWWSYGGYWTCEHYYWNFAYCLGFSSTIEVPKMEAKATGLSIRTFKDDPVIPDNTWTTLYDGSSVATGAWVFYNATLEVISISADWQNWITIADKNLWATTVFNQWDTVSDANCGYFYQWWNNYGFAHSWSLTTSSTQVDASNYWPWDYYNNSTFITWYGWDSSENKNLRWWKTGVLKNAITNKIQSPVVFERSTTPTLADIQSIHDAVVAYGWENVYIKVTNDQIFQTWDNLIVPILRYQWCFEYDILDMGWDNVYNFSAIVTNWATNVYYVWMEYHISNNGSWSLTSFNLITRKITTSA